MRFVSTSIHIRDGYGPDGPRAGPETPGPRASTGLNGPENFSFVIHYCVRKCMPVNIPSKCSKCIVYLCYYPPDRSKAHWCLTKNSWGNSWELIGNDIAFLLSVRMRENRQVLVYSTCWKHWMAYEYSYTVFYGWQRLIRFSRTTNLSSTIF